ncbi:UNVERIFIED_CONTAM: hypothetical protein FKN15_047518 [Acipenser sinensis]
MTSSYAHVMDRQASISSRLESPITGNLENLQAKKNFSVWFQNRRAKFRRNERAMLASKNASLLKSYSGDVTAVEQPIVPRPAPRPNDYLSWGTASPYSAMATYPPTCTNTNTTQGMNMANSIANLRLKAKEYSLNQVPTVN